MNTILKYTKTEKVDFFGNGLCTVCHMAKNELLYFKSFHKLTEDNWGKIDADFESKIAKLIEEDPEHEDEIIESYSMDFYEHQEKYPSIHRTSLVITLYNFLEKELNQLCSTFYESVGRDIVLKDINGQGIERALKYLSKVAGLDISKMGKTLPFIKNVNILRNVIVHNGGVLPTDQNHKIHQFIDSQKHIFGKSYHNSVRFDSEFIDQLIDVLIDFFGELDAEVHKHIQSYLGNKKDKITSALGHCR